MEAKKLEILMTAVDLGSFSKASEVVGYTQSGLTHLVNSLEREIGFPLIIRSHNGISLTEEELGITLCEEQKEAVMKAFTNGLSLIVGPPGTGKTTEIQVISYVFNYLYPNKDEIYAAPSGKAASRMRESNSAENLPVRLPAQYTVNFIYRYSRFLFLSLLNV